MSELTFIDTHAHLDDPRFDPDREDVLRRAFEAVVRAIVTVGCWTPPGTKDHENMDGFSSDTELLSLKGPFPSIYLALGVHPHDAKEVDVKGVSGEIPFELIKTIAANTKKVVAIGETGLDFHYDNSPRDLQCEVFVRHIALARELGLPLIIHSREADSEVIEILKAEGARECGGVIHCFSGTPEMAKEALKLGFYLSFTGIVTFPKADTVRQVVGATPIERILIETDAPYLAPVPFRGKRCEPAHVVETAGKIAELKGLSVNDIARITTLNAQTLFGLGPLTGEVTKKDKGQGDKGPDKGKGKVAYSIRNSLYLNITNRCTNACTFCTKTDGYMVKGHYLKLDKEPEFHEVVSAVDALGRHPTEYDEVVFCGFGEPLLRVELVKKAGLHYKRMGAKVRIDTDGLANLANGRNVLPELKFADCISVSLNAPDAVTYSELCKTPYGEDAYPAIVWFLREAKKHIAKVQATIVALPGLDVEACRRVAEDDIGVAFRVREYNEVG